MLSIGFTGTRHGMTQAQRDAVTFIVVTLAGPPSRYRKARHGDCLGSDAEFHDIARRIIGMRIVVHPGTATSMRAWCRADEVRDPKPFMERNQDIVDFSTVMIATPYEVTEQLRGGTWATIRMARKAGKPLAIVLPSGEVVKERWR